MHRRLLFLALCAPLLSSCHGNDSRPADDGGNAEVKVIALGIPFLDGKLTTRPESFAALEPEVGLNVVLSRGLLTFDVLGIDRGTEIVSATLNVFQRNVEGDPYSVFKAVVVDHVDVSIFSHMNPAMFAGFTLEPDIGVLSEDAEIEDKTLDVTEQVQADVDAGRGISSFRIRGQFVLAPLPRGIHRARFADSSDVFLTGRPPVLEIVVKR